MSGTCPNRWTTMTARVRGVIASASVRGVMSSVSVADVGKAGSGARPHHGGGRGDERVRGNDHLVACAVGRVRSG